MLFEDPLPERSYFGGKDRGTLTKYQELSLIFLGSRETETSVREAPLFKNH